MRTVSDATNATWLAGDAIGSNRAMVRATIVHLQNLLVPMNNLAGDIYSSVVFGQHDQPVELPNIKSCSWVRAIGQDTATLTMVLYNQAPLPIGDSPESGDDFERSGYYTPARGTGTGSSRWGYSTNPWQARIVPDEIVRTYEGYGFDAEVSPEKDTNLYPSGVWRIDDVDFNTDFTITITARDISSVLVDQILFPPIVPRPQYPLRYTAYHLVDNPPVESGSVTWVNPGYSTDSGRPYVGEGGTVYGHHGSDAFDSSDATYWLSIGNARPDQGYSFEYVEGTLPNVKCGAVKVKIWGGPYTMYVSVFSNGKWQGAQTIPYDPHNPVSAPNGSDIAFVVTQHVNYETEVTVSLPKVYDKVTRVRVTFTNLYNSQIGEYHYRAGVRHFQASVGQVVMTSGGTHTEGNYGDFCLDDASEILTKRGWLTQAQLEVGDEALAQDPETGVASWQVIESVYRKHRKRKMLEMSSRNHSSVTTHNHRWLVTDQKGERKWRTTETLRTGQYIPTCAPVDLPIVAKYDDALVRLVAWIYTEGWSLKSGGWGIAQSLVVNPAKVDAIRRDLVSLYGDSGPMRRSRRSALVGEPLWQESVLRDLAVFKLSKFADDGLADVLPDKVPSTEFLVNLTQAQLDDFIEVSVDADGWRKGTQRFFGQKSKARVDAFVMACSLAGLATSVVKGHGQGRYESNEYHTVAILRRKNVVTNALKVQEVDYEGVVWCPTLKHHNFLARRNGQVFFTGNTDIVKKLLAWGGFYWPNDSSLAIQTDADGTTVTIMPPSDDSVLGKGRVWGDFLQTGTSLTAVDPDNPSESVALTMDVNIWDQQPIMDGITYIKNLIGFLFFIDDTGGAIWRLPNIWSIGNWIGDTASDAERTSTVIDIDETQVILQLNAKLSSRNVREYVYIGNVTGKLGAISAGFNPNPTGLRRVAGWTDQGFGKTDECQIMADLIALRMYFQYRTDQLKIAGNPAIQMDDQVRIYERLSNETFIHYVSGITMSFDLESGEYTYTLATYWLGDAAFTDWAFKPTDFSDATQAFLTEVGVI